MTNKCQGTNGKGNPCKLLAIVGEKYCWRHNKVSANRKRTNKNAAIFFMQGLKGIIKDIVRSEVKQIFNDLE